MTERAAFPVLFGYRADEKLQDIRRAGQHFAVVCIPWAMIAPHDEQAQRNHSQTLSRLAGRGGLSAAEAIAVLEDRRFTNIPEWTAHARLARMVLTFAALSPAPDSGERVRHKKRGSAYRVLHRGAELQAATYVFDGMDMVVYQCETDGKVWVRAEYEFDDGRFEPAPDSGENTGGPDDKA